MEPEGVVNDTSERDGVAPDVRVPVLSAETLIAAETAAFLTGAVGEGCRLGHSH
jgi:hypothetical protein